MRIAGDDPTSILAPEAGVAVPVARGVPAGRSPGGKDENTGKASAFSDMLTMGAVEVICTDPVKLLMPSSGPTLAAP